MKIIGYVLYGLAAIDFISGNFFGIDFTGIWWSPIVLAVIGGWLTNMGDDKETTEDPDN